MTTLEKEPNEQNILLADEVIKELEELDVTLDNDGYKAWSYPRIAVGNAIKLIGQYERRGDE